MTRKTIVGLHIEKMDSRGKFHFRVATECEDNESGDFVMWEDAKAEIDAREAELAKLRARISELESPRK